MNKTGSEWKNKRVFISGGSGVIGSALTNSLIKAGACLLIGDLKPRPDGWVNLVKYREGDLITLTKPEIQKFAPEAFFHLAATFERSIETSDFWEENFHHNILLSHHLLSLLKDLPTLQKIVFASSYLIYNPENYLFSSPQKHAVSLTETGSVAPRNLCGMAKMLHEQELFFIKKFRPDLQTISARIFRSYGKNSRDIISRWIRALLKNEQINVYCPEGRFDFVYAEDVAKSLQLLAGSQFNLETAVENNKVMQDFELKSLSMGTDHSQKVKAAPLESDYGSKDCVNLFSSTAVSRFNGIVNVGSGKSRSIHEVLEVLQKHFGPFTCKIDKADIPYEASQADMSLFHKTIKSCSFRSLEEVIPDLIAFERTHL